jgi:hypothetical protein
MIDRMVTIVGAALSLVAVSEPAMAAIAQVPEPATMSLFGIGAAGAFVAKRFVRRK